MPGACGESGGSVKGYAHRVLPMYISSRPTFSRCTTFSPRRSRGAPRRPPMPPPVNMLNRSSMPDGPPAPAPSLMASSPNCGAQLPALRRAPPPRGPAGAVWTAAGRPAHLVIYLPLLWVPQHVIRLVDLLELVGVAACGAAPRAGHALRALHGRPRPRASQACRGCRPSGQLLPPNMWHRGPPGGKSRSSAPRRRAHRQSPGRSAARPTEVLIAGPAGAEGGLFQPLEPSSHQASSMPDSSVVEGAGWAGQNTVTAEDSCPACSSRGAAASRPAARCRRAARRTLVGVVLQRELPVRFLELGIARARLHAQYFVVPRAVALLPSPAEGIASAKAPGEAMPAAAKGKATAKHRRNAQASCKGSVSLELETLT